MLRIERILCPVDFSAFSRRALDYAMAIARWYGARVTALHVHPIGTPSAMIAPGAPTVIEPVVMSAADRKVLAAELSRFVDAERAEGVRVDMELREGSVWREIQDAAADVDLLALGTHGRAGFERFMLGSVTEKLLRRIACPVLTVPPAVPDAVPLASAVFTRILCPVDFSQASDRALAWAVALAQEADADLTLVHVVDLPGSTGLAGAPGIDSEAYRLAYERWTTERLREAVPAEARQYCRISELVTVGRAHREILRIAGERGIDLIAMGAAGHGAFERAFVGSTAQHVVRGAACPVLTTRSV